MGRGRRTDDDARMGFAHWGDYFTAKKCKLQEQYETDTVQRVEKKSDIFKGVAIFINGLTHPGSEDLKQLMAQHGGGFHVYQTSATTHIIASNLPNVKINKLGSVPIVKPSWITDSIELERLLDYKRYLLYTNQSSTQPRLDFAPKTASDPDFLGEFYNNSRLHLISTLGSEFKQKITQLRQSDHHSFPGMSIIDKDKDTPHDPVIMHIDMDCFFVSVGLRKRPDLKGQPVAVTHARNPQINASKEREEAVYMNLDRLPMRMENVDGKSSMSEIASCSYEARQFGVKNGMFLGAAVKLCPNLKMIPYDFSDYKQVSHQLYDIMASYTLDIEAVSCDEMYVDITSILRRSGMTVKEWAEFIRAEITSKTQCPCSTGFGSNRLQARMATKKAKPNGSYYLDKEVVSYMSAINLSDLPGVGRVLLEKLQSMGLTKCQDVQQYTLAQFNSTLQGKNWTTVWEQSHGIDRRGLNYNQERKSVSAEINYGIRFRSLDECLKFIRSLADEVWTRLEDIKMRSKCVTLKIMVRAPEAPLETAKYLGHGLCDNQSKSVTTNQFVTGPDHIYRETKSLYEKLKVGYRELRGLGIQLSKLEETNVRINRAMEKFLRGNEQPTSNCCDKKKTSATTTTSSDNHGLHDFFKSTKSNQNLSKLTMTIDPEVLKELPLEIQEEILTEYNLSEQQQQTKIDVPTTTTTSTSPFVSLDWCQLKQVLSDWIKSTDLPKSVDVEMLGDHFKQSALDRRIEMLLPAFNFLHRRLNDSTRATCDWHRAYYRVAGLTQEGMVARYGATLTLNRSFDGCDCDWPSA